jgi:thiamine biosynthesis protein ThiI
VDSVSSVVEKQFDTIDELVAHVVEHFAQRIPKGASFCVRVKRRGHHELSSTEMERLLGHKIGRVADHASVNLKTPDFPIHLEVENNKVFLIDQSLPGLGGFPVGTQEAVLSLTSGGYDSSVSAFEMIRRGVKTHYLFFNLGGTRHETGVREVAWHLWSHFGGSHRVFFLSVPFEGVVGEILEKVSEGYRGVVLKRMMLRAASRLADRFRLKALVTGESIGQVSSQTLTNLCVIDSVVDKLVIRPLIVMDKLDIINRAKQIGTEPLTRSMPEYCGVISSRPIVDAKEESVVKVEKAFDWAVLDQAVRSVNVLDIQTLSETLEEEMLQVEVVKKVLPKDVIIDVRSIEEQEISPLEVAETEVLHIPFYRLKEAIPTLDPARRHLLYCDRGTMSKIQAMHLIDGGISLTKVFQPDS